MTRIDQQTLDQTVHFDMPGKSRRQGPAVMTVNLTPAIDITFNLLIFFLVATTFKAAEGILPSRVPTEQGVLQAAPLPISPIKIRITQLGDAADDFSLGIDNWRKKPESFVELTRILQTLVGMPGFDQQTPVVIFSDNDVRWDHVVNCFNAIRRVRIGSEKEPFKNITFAVK